MDSRRRLLELLVSLHDRHERPIGVDELTDRLDADQTAIRDQLVALCSYELVESDRNGWVPTVTGRELLALDVDQDEFIIIDVPDDTPNGG